MTKSTTETLATIGNWLLLASGLAITYILINLLK